MEIPSAGQCRQFMHNMHMMDHIVDHSLQVCRVADFLARHLNRIRRRLDRDLITAAALLHDITKTRSFETGENHAQTGAALLVEMGYAEVADIVRQHVRLDRYGDGEALTEAAIVNYADKRVLHDRIVSLEERMAYIVEKYATKPSHIERIRCLWQKTGDLEARIFADLAFSPSEVGVLLARREAEDRQASVERQLSTIP